MPLKALLHVRPATLDKTARLASTFCSVGDGTFLRPKITRFVPGTVIGALVTAETLWRCWGEIVLVIFVREPPDRVEVNVSECFSVEHVVVLSEAIIWILLELAAHNKKIAVYPNFYRVWIIQIQRSVTADRSRQLDHVACVQVYDPAMKALHAASPVSDAIVLTEIDCTRCNLGQACPVLSRKGVILNNAGVCSIPRAEGWIIVESWDAAFS